ncbi:MAG: UDP-glucose 4-epimerase GalE [Thermodesulfobacteriota bacterium]
MRVLVVGGAGYIGAHMVRMLLAEGREVTVFDNLSTGHAWAVPDGLLVRGDLLERSSVNRLFAEHSFDAVMHFSALSIVPESVQKPLLYWRNNVGGTLNLLNAMLEHGVEKFIFSSTAAVFGAPEYTPPNFAPMDEAHPCRPITPYGKSKLAVEQALADLAASGQMRSIAFRYFNAAGADPGGGIGEAHDPETHLIPVVLKALKAGNATVTVYGDDYDTPDGACVRDYVHVNDLSRAHLLGLDYLANHPGAHVFNLGSENGFSVLQVIAAIEEVTGLKAPYEIGPRRPGDPPVLVAASGKAKRELGWRPEFADLRETIRTAWAWHSA